ncbi:hypothetical protein [Umezawaea sp.]|uniref:hypothetical protein n=1 Tax=Umezawaea sp. TaxID=1955258 RepID=UPI002ED658F5
MSTRFDIPLLYRTLEVEEHESLRALLRKARSTAFTLPHLVLSVFEQEGVRLGSGSADELRRARGRAADYAAVVEHVSSEVRVDVMKGPALARRYPSGILRPAGDLDLVVPDEVALWRVARLVDALAPTTPEVSVSLLGGGPDRHVVASLTWPAADAVLDRDIRVDISTMAFPGDQAAVPVRAPLPPDPWLADLLSVTEERFQRAFTAKDVLDLVVLDDDAPDDLASVVDAAARHRVAPELAELVSRAASVVDLRALAPLAGSLAPHAERELETRAAHGTGPGTDVPRRIAAGVPVYGMPLRVERRPEREVVAVRRAGDAHLAATPFGDYLLVGSGLVDPLLHESALRELDRPHRPGAVEGSPS